MSLHSQPAVRSRLARHACARLAAAPADPTWHAWQRVLDLAVLVRNALWLQVQVPRPGGDLLVYVGQSYAHLLRDHAVQATRDLSLLGFEEPVDLPAPRLDGLLAAIARDRSDPEAADLANALLADALDVLAAVVDAASLTMEWLEQVGGVGEVGAVDGVAAADAEDGTRSDVRRARQVRRLLCDWVAGHAARLVVLDRGRS
ncbi:hypothetical protein GCM10025868_28910 [Angustibacter aerolatus]|uniref:Uncharacterized protein n=1 Tax=Angustibacter aerolatus TaxID=1162965 RepID=A0ABQ6JHD6_9ACTN|nr:hypothetical protein [Angustibacter aerolatus]GMA87641.1 hypothetical protein GCM10025868_28910 [Angustibacter aerolatus]